MKQCCKAFVHFSILMKFSVSLCTYQCFPQKVGRGGILRIRPTKKSLPAGISQNTLPQGRDLRNRKVPKFSDGMDCGQTVCRPRSDCSRSSLIRVYTVCHSICIFWTHYSIAEPPCSNFRVITANFSGVQNFKIFTVP